MFLDLLERVRVRILYALARSSVLFVTLIFTRLINAIFKIRRILLEKPHPKGGSYFPIYADIFIFIFLYLLYYTTYNTAHAASRLWRYSSIYINPFRLLTYY